MYVEDCTGCGLCVEACPVVIPGTTVTKAINLGPGEPRLAAERENITFFETLPTNDRSRVDFGTVRGSQFLEPLFEFSGACAGCGETPYLKLLSQLFGDRLMIANATGCSSIYGGNLPTTPWTTDADGRGPAWSNSLFEDNAEFGLGMRLASDAHAQLARRRLAELRDVLGAELVDAILAAPQLRESELHAQRQRVAELQRRLDGLDPAMTGDLRSVVDHLVRRSVWIVGGDGWAYDIGSGGLDHVLASGRNVNVLVLDTEVYSNTGGQMSKATPLGAVAKFAAAGKTVPLKDLALQAIAYGNVYVAKVAMGADPQQTLQAFREAEAYDGPSLVIAYSQCIAHGIDMRLGMDQQYRAVASGHWPLIRYDPVLRAAGENPFLLDSHRPRIPLADYRNRELRYRSLANSDPAEYDRLLGLAEQANRSALECLRGDGFPRSRTLPPPTPAGSTDGAVDSLSGPHIAQPAGRVGITAVADRRRRPAPRRRRRRCGGALFAVRRATAPRGGAERTSCRGRRRELRRGPVVLSGRSRRGPRPTPVPEPARTRGRAQSRFP